MGIAIVHQELAVLHDMTVSDNIFAGRELTRGMLLDIPKQEAQSAQVLHQLKQRIHERAYEHRLLEIIGPREIKINITGGGN